MQDTERRPEGDRRRQGVGEEKEGQRGKERNDNPFGGHNAEPGTVKLTRQEIRPTNRPLPPFSSLSLSLSVASPVLLFAPLPRSELTPGYMQTAIAPSGPVINLLNYITRTRYLSVHHVFLPPFVPATLFTRPPFLFFLINSVARVTDGPLETDGMLIRRDSAVNTIHSLFQTSVRVKIGTIRTVK